MLAYAFEGEARLLPWHDLDARGCTLGAYLACVAGGVTGGVRVDPVTREVTAPGSADARRLTAAQLHRAMIGYTTGETVGDVVVALLA